MRSWGVMVCVLAAATASAQSLGDAAQKERERRDKVHAKSPSSHTVTDEDLAANKGQLANDPGATAAPARTEGEAIAEPASETRVIVFEASEAQDAVPAGGGGEAYWRGRATRARQRVEKAQRKYDSLLRQITIGQPWMYNQNGQRVIYSAQTMKARADQAEAELLAAQQALEDFEQEARRARALPGWLR